MSRCAWYPASRVIPSPFMKYWLDEFLVDWQARLAAQRRLALLASRRDDPSAQHPEARDWRDQETADVEELTGDEGD